MSRLESDDLCFSTILDSLDAAVYVADLETYELLFMNAYARERIGEGRSGKCWQVLQCNQEGPCSFCNNAQLLDEQGEPVGVLVWEFQNTRNGHWYQCRDLAVRLSNGRMVRVEVATDITERVEMERALKDAVTRAERLACTDDLTGLNNRRAFFTHAEQALKQARRYRTPTALVMFDIDHFKQINDTYGHAAGDEALRALAANISNEVREADVLARLGGEEFAILMPKTTRLEARIMAERLQKTINATEILHEGQCVQLTASFGLMACEDNSKTLDLMLSQADHAMYASKRNGRNTITEYTPACGQE